MSCFWLSEWQNTNKQQKKKTHTFNCTGLQVCLKIVLHTYAQVQDSQCIAHLWENWVLAVKTNGHGRHEVPNYLILKQKIKKRCRQAKADPPSILCIQEFDFQTSNKWRKETWGTMETDWTSTLNSWYTFGSHKSSSLWLELLIKYWIEFEFRWSPIMHTVPLVPPSWQTESPTIKHTQVKMYNTNGNKLSAWVKPAFM